ncbi:MAG: FAD-dependent oxidoreductase [Pirellulales bacterium]|nr:FAD-dependent oxidoreductase [Pirellulales bacterium]
MTNRRDFIKIGAAASLAPITTKSVFGQSQEKSEPEDGVFFEPKHKVPVSRETDVIVCGGGPAGFAAAISAARQGARTSLIEMHGCLGGVWTAGLLSNIIDFRDKNGIMKELVDRLEKSDAQYTAKVYDAELMKLTLDQMCLEAGVNIRLHTRVSAAYANSKNRLEYIVTDSFSGREAWKAKVFIDATGNGDLAAQASCKYDVGQPGTGKTQPMSLMAIITGVEEDELVREGLMQARGKSSASCKAKLYKEIKRAGIDASYTKPTMFAIRPGLIAIMANHQYGVSAFNANHVTQATLEARREVNDIIDGLRGLGDIWKNVRIIATGEQIGIREGRRIHGRYMLTKDDLIKGARFDDAVCRVNFCVDVHALDKNSGGGYGSHGIHARPYDVPLRSLIAKDVQGLMMAGRCISGDFFAHASYRVTGNSVQMGEAAGQVAAKAALKNTLPENVSYTV